MTCQICRDGVSARLDGELTWVEDAAVAEHLASCAGCRGVADRMASVTRLLRVRPVEVHPDLVDRVLPTPSPAPAVDAPPRVAPASCGCSASCSCGCQDGRPCRCGHQAA